MAASNAGKGRIAIKDVLDKTAESDPEYQRVVRELQDGQPRSGWLIGRGAFDRQDLQYIADFREAERQKEQDLRDTESSEYASLRSRFDGQALPDAAPPRSTPLPAHAKAMAKEKRDSKPTTRLKPVVKPINGKLPSARSSSVEPSPKRIKTESPPPVEPQQQQAPGSKLPVASAAKDEGIRPPSQSKDEPTGQSIDDAGGEEPGNGLAGLLGAYPSSDESEEGEG